MRILVTGGAGFIGSALCNQLIEADHEVRVIDDLSAGEKDRLDPRVQLTRGDVADIPKLWRLLLDVDCVYHLAARVSVPESIKYPRDYNHVNVGGTVSVMEAMRDAGVRRVVLASSGAVYGQQAQSTLHEDLIPDPDSPYAVSKLAAETYVRTIGTLWGIETVALRIFNAYGPHQQLPPSHPPVIPRFLRSALTGASVVIYGDGHQTRDFVYLDDIVDALVSASTAPDVDRQVINVGSGQPTSLLELIDTIGAISGREIEPIHNMQQSAGVRSMCADLNRAHELLNFTPKIGLREGLERTIQLDERFH
ncbi:MAG: NAD-dependent epimerase/dehydratase family protein [Chloroflexi bacterium]|nr:NAD-dependent epimerase/dehydratase family protein [Chloroflexota bacterium]